MAKINDFCYSVNRLKPVKLAAVVAAAVTFSPALVRSFHL